MTRLKIVQARVTFLTSPITSGATSIVLDNLVDIYGNELSMTDFGDIGYVTIDPGVVGSEEICSFTGITANDNGTFTLTGVTRALKAKSDYATGGTASSHSGGSVVVVSNNPQIYEAILDYIDGIAIAGAPDASLTAKGLVEIATQTEIDNDEDFGATGAYVAVTPDQLVLSKYGTRLPTADEKSAIGGSQGVVGSSNKLISQDNTSASSGVVSQTTSTNTFEVGEANATTKKNTIAQKFTATKTKMAGVKLWKKADTGTFTGTVTVSLRADSSGSPSGSSLASVVISNANWLKITADTEFSALFASEYSSLVAGTSYWIVVTPSTSDNSNRPNLGGRTSGGTGNVKYNNSTDGWVAISAADLYYQIVEGSFSQIAMTDSTGKLPQRLSRYSFLDLDRTTTQVINTTTETDVYSKPLPQPMTASSGFKVRVSGNFGVESVTVDSTNQIRIKLNGSTVLSVALDASSFDNQAYFMFEAYVLNTSLSAQEYIYYLNSWRNFADSGGGTTNHKSLVQNDVGMGTSAVTTGVFDVLTVSAQNSDTGTDDQVTVTSVLVELIE